MEYQSLLKTKIYIPDIILVPLLAFDQIKIDWDMEMVFMIDI